MNRDLIEPRHINWPFVLKYFILFLIGIVILLVSGWLLDTRPIVQGEYHYSSILRNGYNFLSVIFFCAAAFFAGYKFRLNPWLTGISLIAIFPVTAMIEGTIYRGSHNLIPFEFGMHFLFALPGIAAAYLGKYFAGRKAMVTHKSLE